MKKGGDGDDRQELDPQRDLQDYVDLMFVDDVSPPVPATVKKHRGTVRERFDAAEPVSTPRLQVDNSQANFMIAEGRKGDEHPVSHVAGITVPERSLVQRPLRGRLAQHEPLPSRLKNAESLERQLVRDRVKNLTQRMRQSAEADQTLKTAQAVEAKPAQVKKAPLLAEPRPKVPETKGVEPANTFSDCSRATVQRKTASLQKPAEGKPKNNMPPELAVPSEQIAAELWCDNGRPKWAQESFECLLFKISGLTMAVPLVELGSIYPINDELTPIFGQAKWFIGLMSVAGSNIRTVNTAKIVMPERYDEKFLQDIRYIISIDGYDWGLAVDCVDKAVTLEPEAVRWRTARSKRPWLAGTVVEYMCALLDVQAMAQMLNQSDQHLSH